MSESKDIQIHTSGGRRGGKSVFGVSPTERTAGELRRYVTAALYFEGLKPRRLLGSLKPSRLNEVWEYENGYAGMSKSFDQIKLDTERYLMAVCGMPSQKSLLRQLAKDPNEVTCHHRQIKLWMGI